MFRSPETIRRTVEDGFGRRHVLVVGDLMLDAYLWGNVSRVSPEAPVPVVRLSRRSETPGGAGNVARNLAALGLDVVVAGLVGDDDPGRRLRRLLEDASVEGRTVVASDGRPTITKSRVIGGHQQMLRIDEEVPGPVPEADQDRLLEAIEASFPSQPAAVVLSDYDKGAMTPRVCRALTAEARRRGVPVLVDPKGRDFRKYARATALTPNRHEFERATGVGDRDEPPFREAAQRLRDGLELDFLAVTRGELGVSVFDEGGDRDIPAVAREVFDVSGAGDTLVATLAAGLAAGLDRDDAVRLANVAAGVVVGKVGTALVRRDELLTAMLADPLAAQSDKVCGLDALLRRIMEWRARGEKVVFTNGCFDLLHLGHISLLARARGEGDRLVVGLNSDRSVRALKGEGRPVVGETDRAHVLAGLGCVDAVVVFEEETPRRLVETLRPDVLVKGADYSDKAIVGADLVRSWGGTVVLVPLVDGRSTTQILARRT